MGAPRSQLRQWSSSAWALSAVFFSFPLVGWLVLHTWEFDGATEIAVLLFILGAYFRLRSRQHPTKADPATQIEQAARLANDGQPDRAIKLLSKTIRQSPKLWQAYQYRGELRLRTGEVALASQDFAAAIQLAPEEAHLRHLRDRAQELALPSLGAHSLDE